MPPLENLVSFATVAFVLIVIPGPSVMFVIGRALALGRRAALFSVLGNTTGVYLQAVLVAAGLGTVLGTYVGVFSAIKLVGSAYLVYLGLQAIIERRDLPGLVTGSAPELRAPLRFRQGFIVGATNPKGFVLFSAVLPQFVEPARGSVSLQMVIFGTIAVLIALVTDSAWATVAGTARGWLGRSRRRGEMIGAAGGCMMIGLGLQLAVSGRRDH